MTDHIAAIAALATRRREIDEFIKQATERKSLAQQEVDTWEARIFQARAEDEQIAHSLAVVRGLPVGTGGES